MAKIDPHVNRPHDEPVARAAGVPVGKGVSRVRVLGSDDGRMFESTRASHRSYFNASLAFHCSMLGFSRVFVTGARGCPNVYYNHCAKLLSLHPSFVSSARVGYVMPRGRDVRIVQSLSTCSHYINIPLVFVVCLKGRCCCNTHDMRRIAYQEPFTHLSNSFCLKAFSVPMFYIV